MLLFSLGCAAGKQGGQPGDVEESILFFFKVPAGGRGGTGGEPDPVLFPFFPPFPERLRAQQGSMTWSAELIRLDPFPLFSDVSPRPTILDYPGGFWRRGRRRAQRPAFPFFLLRWGGASSRPFPSPRRSSRTAHRAEFAPLLLFFFFFPTVSRQGGASPFAAQRAGRRPTTVVCAALLSSPFFFPRVPTERNGKAHNPQRPLFFFRSARK